MKTLGCAFKKVKVALEFDGIHQNGGEHPSDLKLTLGRFRFVVYSVDDSRLVIEVFHMHFSKLI